MLKEHTVCEEGHPLTPEQARILKLFEIAMVEFKITLLCTWAGTSGDFKRYVAASALAGASHAGSDEDDEDDE